MTKPIVKNPPRLPEVRTFGGGLMTLSAVLWITYASARGNQGVHFLPRWTLYLSWIGLIVGVVVVVGSMVWPTKRPKA